MQRRRSKWNCPSNGQVKCNYDCGFSINEEKTKAAWIDDKEFYLEACQSRVKGITSPLEA